MILAWLGAVLIGLSLGLLGSGGSILTVPVLIYFVGEPEKLAIAESLAIVGGISLFGAIPYVLQKKVDWHSFLWFGVPGVVGTYLGAALSKYLSGTIQLLLFAAVMLIAAVMMFKGKHKKTKTSVNESPENHQENPQKTEGQTQTKKNPIIIILEGLCVGVLTGIVGVGGGFLIIPALVLLGGLPMHIAVGTSLLIIAIKSFAGFYKYLQIMSEQNISMHWDLILIFTAIGILGSLFGARLGKKISNELLRKYFAVFLIFMGMYVLFSNIGKI